MWDLARPSRFLFSQSQGHSCIFWYKIYAKLQNKSVIFLLPKDFLGKFYVVVSGEFLKSFFSDSGETTSKM